MTATGPVRSAVVACFALLAGAAPPEVCVQWRRAGRGEEADGAVAGRDLLLTWGRQTAIRRLPDGSPARVTGRSLAAALMDVDGDGAPDAVVCEADPPALAWYVAPHWTRHLIESGTETYDLLPATIGKQRGLLAIHKRSQLRFYSVPEDPRLPWPVRDLYSIYTPSWQGGLALADVDGDGAQDILAGNYWLRAPASPELPWRLFAINTWTEEQLSGVLHLAPARNGLAAAQRELEPGRLAWFDRPPDPRELWPARSLGAWNRPAGLVAADFTGDGSIDLLIAEGGPPGRVVLFEAPDYKPRVLRSGVAARALAWTGSRILLLTRDALETGTVLH